MSSPPLAGLRRRRPLERDRRRLLHQAARRRRRRGRQGRAARGRSAAAVVGVRRRDRRRRRRRAVRLPRRRRKQSVVVDPDDAADLERAGTLLDARRRGGVVAGIAAGRAPGAAPEAIRGAAPHLTVTSITPFGLEGPWADRPATELTLQAWSGGIVGPRPRLARPGAGPRRRPDRRVAHRRLRRHRDDGVPGRARRRGELVDVSMLETLALCLTYYPVTLPRHGRAGRSAAGGRS